MEGDDLASTRYVLAEPTPKPLSGRAQIVGVIQAFMGDPAGVAVPVEWIIRDTVTGQSAYTTVTNHDAAYVAAKRQLTSDLATLTIRQFDEKYAVHRSS